MGIALRHLIAFPRVEEDVERQRDRLDHPAAVRLEDRPEDALLQRLLVAFRFSGQWKRHLESIAAPDAGRLEA
jgi:hypothetical protein